jgi:NAD(P)H-flavin reductase
MTDEPEWDGETRMIDAAMLRDVLGGELGGYTYLVAGPPPMVEAVEAELRGAGVPEEQVRPERFSGY